MDVSEKDSSKKENVQIGIEEFGSSEVDEIVKLPKDGDILSTAFFISKFTQIFSLFGHSTLRYLFLSPTAEEIHKQQIEKQAQLAYTLRGLTEQDLLTIDAEILPHETVIYIYLVTLVEVGSVMLFCLLCAIAVMLVFDVSPWIFLGYGKYTHMLGEL